MKRKKYSGRGTAAGSQKGVGKESQGSERHTPTKHSPESQEKTNSRQMGWIELAFMSNAVGKRSACLA